MRVLLLPAFLLLSSCGNERGLSSSRISEIETFQKDLIQGLEADRLALLFERYPEGLTNQLTEEIRFLHEERLRKAIRQGRRWEIAGKAKIRPIGPSSFGERYLARFPLRSPEGTGALSELHLVLQTNGWRATAWALVVTNRDF